MTSKWPVSCVSDPREGLSHEAWESGDNRAGHIHTLDLALLADSLLRSQDVKV